MATEQTGTNLPSAGTSPFAQVFSQVLGAGTNIAVDLLKTRGEVKLAEYDAQKMLATQRAYNQLAMSSPNLGPNDPQDAKQAAIQQTDLLTRIIPSDQKGWLMLVGILIVAAILFRILKR